MSQIIHGIVAQLSFPSNLPERYARVHEFGQSLVPPVPFWSTSQGNATTRMGDRRRFGPLLALRCRSLSDEHSRPYLTSPQNGDFRHKGPPLADDVVDAPVLRCIGVKRPDLLSGLSFFCPTHFRWVRVAFFPLALSPMQFHTVDNFLARRVEAHEESEGSVDVGTGRFIIDHFAVSPLSIGKAFSSAAFAFKPVFTSSIMFAGLKLGG